MTEGDCATKEFYQILLCTHSPSVATATAPSAGSLGLCGLLCQRTDGKPISNLHDGRPLVAPTTVKVVSRYKSNFSATLKPVGALIERPLGHKATKKAVSCEEGSVSAQTGNLYQTCRGDHNSAALRVTNKFVLVVRSQREAPPQNPSPMEKAGGASPSPTVNGGTRTNG